MAGLFSTGQKTVNLGKPVLWAEVIKGTGSGAVSGTQTLPGPYRPPPIHTVPRGPDSTVAPTPPSYTVKYLPDAPGGFLSWLNGPIVVNPPPSGGGVPFAGGLSDIAGSAFTQVKDGATAAATNAANAGSAYWPSLSLYDAIRTRIPMSWRKKYRAGYKTLKGIANNPATYGVYGSIGSFGQWFKLFQKYARNRKRRYAYKKKRTFYKKKRPFKFNKTQRRRYKMKK